MDTSTIKTPQTKTDKLASHKEAGATMMAVLLMMTMATATAVIGIQTATREIGSSGLNKQKKMVDGLLISGVNLSLSYVDKIGAQAVIRTVERSPIAGDPGDYVPILEFEKAKVGTKLFAFDYSAIDASKTDGGVNTFAPFNAWSAEPLTDDDRLAEQGKRRSYFRTILTDLRVQSGVPGARADGYGNLKMFTGNYITHATISPNTSDSLKRHRSSMMARARVVIGPVGI